MYQTGTASGTADLLDKLNTFAVAAGWTLNRRDASSLSISKGTVFQNLFENGSEIQMRLATSYDGGLAWNAQPGSNPWTQRSREMVGSFTRYHFFANGDHIYVVVEVDPGLYKHMIFGLMNKTPGWTGGEFSCVVILDTTSNVHGLFGCSDSSFGAVYSAMNTVRAVVDGDANIWRQLNSNEAETAAIVRSSENWHAPNDKNSYYTDWFINTPNTSTQQVVFIPVHLYLERTSGFFSPLGFIDDLRMVNIINIDPGATVTIGSDQWLVFPEYIKGGSSLNQGYAYKIIP